MARMMSEGEAWGAIGKFVGILAFVFWVIGGFGMFASKTRAVKALQNQGYTEIEITNHAWFAIGYRGCGSEDAARFTATAKNIRGEKVEDLIVCSGLWFKGATPRTR